MADNDLRMPRSEAEMKALIGNQGNNNILRMMGMTVLSMLAIHYGSYALKNAATTVVRQYGNSVRFTASRTTSIAEDIFGLGAKLDRYSTRQLGQITDRTPLSTEFALRVKARAAQQVKRAPFEFIPAYMVDRTFRQQHEPDDSMASRLESAGYTAMTYILGDIFIGAAFRPLARTQAAKIAKENLQRVGPKALWHMEKITTEGAIRGSSTLRAMGAMYKQWQSLPMEERVPSSINIKKLWEQGKQEYTREAGKLRNRVSDAYLPDLYHRLASMHAHMGSAATRNAQDAYNLDWIDNLGRISRAHGRPLTSDQARAINYAIAIGQDTKFAFRPQNLKTPIIRGSEPWYKRWGHDQKSIQYNMEEMQTILANVPQYRNLSRSQLNRLLQEATEATDQMAERGVWVGGRRSGRMLPLGDENISFTAELEGRAVYRYFRGKYGLVDPSKRNILGVRAVSWQEFRNSLVSGAGTTEGRNVLEQARKFDDMIASISPGGREGNLYKNFQKLSVGPTVYTGDNIQGYINFTLARSKAYAALNKLEGFTKIPILNFSPLQLIQWRARMQTPESRWVPVSARHPSLGGVIETPHFQIGGNLFRFEGTVVSDIARGRLRKLPGEYTQYVTKATTTTGRLVRNVMGLGEDVRQQYPEAGTRWLYRGPRRRRVAEALNISPFTSKSIGSTIKSWWRGAPSYRLASLLERRFPGAAASVRAHVDPTYWPKEFDRLLAGEATATEVSEILGQAASLFHPGLPPHILARATSWLPHQYQDARNLFFRRGAVGPSGRAAPAVDATIGNTASLLEDISQSRSSLSMILDILEEDALAQGYHSSKTMSLFNSLLRGHKDKLIRERSYLSRVLEPNRFAIGEYTVEDKVRRDIVSYLIARPTTINTIRGADAASQFIPLLQVTQLDNLVGAIEGLGRTGRHIGSQVKGAVASIKLTAYRARYSNPAETIAAIHRDRSIVQEMDTMVREWMRFPFGKAWRTPGPNQRNAQVVLNRFADEFTYMETARSAWKRDPLGTIAGVAGPGGVKTGVSLGAYHITNRLRAALRLIGLDFKEGSYTNMMDMLVGGFIFRRILPAMALVELYRYVDWKMEEWSGTGAGEAAFRAGVVEPTTALAHLSDIIGLREGFEWFGKVTGEEDRMNFLKYATMSGPEMREFWERGEVPVRRGRWWLLSPTPFEGQRTQFFIPNMYRRLQSRYQYTWEGGRGPEEFYFANSWLPNPDYPLAPLRRIFDPYAYEKYTYNIRPYPLTGEFFRGPYGPVSPILNTTVGELIKPTRRMHEEYWTGITAGIGPYGQSVPGVSWPVPASATAGSGIGSAAGLVRAQIAGGNQATVGMAQAGLTQQPAYGIGAPATYMLMGSVGVPAQAVTAATPPGIWTAPAPIAAMSDSAYRLQEMAGIYGFSAQAVRTTLGLAPEYQAISYIPRASEAYSFQQSFWGLQMGGLGDFVLPGQSELSNITFSEIFRRFVPRPPTSTAVNPVPNAVWQQERWLPGPYSGYFEDYSMGDIYGGSYAALRFPGEAYARAYGVHPDEKRGMVPYGPIDRLRILSKVAPWSQEYRTYNRSVSRMALSPEDEAAYQVIRSQVAEINKKYQFAPYRFRGLELEERDYTFMGVTPEGYLQVRGLGTPIRLAGLAQSAALGPAIQERLEPGERIRLKFDVNRPRFDYENEQRVLEAVVGGLNEELLEEGMPPDVGGSALSYYARTGPIERMAGTSWEAITHNWNPLTTKFVQRRTALEHYERSQVYGLDYAPWSQPYSSFIRPLFESVGAKGFGESILTGAAAGALTGRGPARVLLAALGGTTFGLNKFRTKAEEWVTGDAWVPRHVEKRWEQEEYMDVLQYLSAARNYSLLRRRAISAGEPDPETLWQRDQSIKSWMAEQKRNIRASILERSVYGGVSKNEYFASHPQTATAFSWRQRMAQTLYGANLTGDYLTLQKAIPKERRMFFESFLNAPAQDRDRILDLLPPLERRIYQSAWGMQVDPKPTLNEYFSNHFLPGPEAAIWSPNLDWDNLRIRMVEAAGGDPSKYGYYPQEVKEAELYPVPVPTMDMNQSKSIRELLMQLLGGHGIEGLNISVMPSPEPGFSVNFNVTKNMRPFYEEAIATQLGAL